MKSCNNFTYQLYSFIGRHRFNLEVKKANKAYEKQALPRKLGRGRCERGPDDYTVPYCYNLESRSIRQIKKQWDIDTSLKAFKLAEYLSKLSANRSQFLEPHLHPRAKLASQPQRKSGNLLRKSTTKRPQ